jgi:hypothetical protein
VLKIDVISDRGSASLAHPINRASVQPPRVRRRSPPSLVKAIDGTSINHHEHYALRRRLHSAQIKPNRNRI